MDNIITRALSDAHGSAQMNSDLRQNIIKWMDRSKEKEFQDIGLMTGGPSKLMCVGEHYDETKPRIKHNHWKAMMGLSNHMVDRDTSVLSNTLDELGAMIGSKVNHHCGNCQYAQTTLSAQYVAMTDSTNVTASLRCGLPGNLSVCPDADQLRVREISFEQFRDEYQGQFNNYNPLFETTKRNPYATDFSMDMERGENGEYLRSSTKSKEIVNDTDIAVEILKLDKRYGLY